MQQVSQKKDFLFPNKEGLNEKEVQAVVLQEMKPYTEAISPESAPYLTVEHFLWFIGILVTIASSLLGYLWKKINENNASINARLTESNGRIHQRIDKAKDDIESSESEIRGEFTRRCDIIDKRLWYIALNTPTKIEVDKK